MNHSPAKAGTSFRPLAVDAPELFAFYAQNEFGEFAPWSVRFVLLGLLAAFAFSVVQQRIISGRRRARD